MATPSGGFQPRERRFAAQEQDWDNAPPKRPRFGAGSKSGGRRLIVVLEGASLETVKVVWNRVWSSKSIRFCGDQGHRMDGKN